MDKFFKRKKIPNINKIINWMKNKYFCCKINSI